MSMSIPMPMPMSGIPPFLSWDLLQAWAMVRLVF